MKNFVLSFEELIKEVRQFYKDVCQIKALPYERRQKYLRDQLSRLEQCLNQVLELDERPKTIGDWDPYYVLLGHFFEGFVKTILMLEDFDDFFLNYYDEKKPLKKYEYAKQKLLTILRNKNLTNKQHKRIGDVLEYVQLQRNNFVHFPLKGFDHPAVRYEIYMVIKKLCELFEVNFSEETIKRLDKAIEKERNITGMKFQDVWGVESRG